MSSKDKHSLQAILEAISKIHRFTKDHSDPDSFNEDDKAFDAVMMNFIVIGEMVSRISSDTKKANTQIDWNRIKGFRNLVAHDYFGIDAEEVWQIIVNDLSTLKKEIDKILSVSY
jgi:uncharacterized protein with HEPN domain